MAKLVLFFFLVIVGLVLLSPAIVLMSPFYFIYKGFAVYYDFKKAKHGYNEPQSSGGSLLGMFMPFIKDSLTANK